MIKTIGNWMDNMQAHARAETVRARQFSDKKRSKLADSGAAMPDGSYPIVTKGDLQNAVDSYGRSPDEATKRHIIKRARALGATDQLPANWPGSTKKEKGAKAAADPSHDPSGDCSACGY